MNGATHPRIGLTLVAYIVGEVYLLPIWKLIVFNSFIYFSTCVTIAAPCEEDEFRRIHGTCNNLLYPSMELQIRVLEDYCLLTFTKVSWINFFRHIKLLFSFKISSRRLQETYILPFKSCKWPIWKSALILLPKHCIA